MESENTKWGIKVEMHQNHQPFPPSYHPRQSSQIVADWVDLYQPLALLDALFTQLASLGQ